MLRNTGRFDPSGCEYHEAAPAGDRLVDGEYQPIVNERLDQDRLRAYSEALGLYMCWESGMLRFFDPGTESYLQSHDEDTARTTSAEARAEEERAARMAAQARGKEERDGRLSAESRHAEFEAELRRLRGE